MKPRTSFHRFAKDSSGAAALEYAVVTSLIVVVSVGTIRGLSGTLNVLLSTSSQGFGPVSAQGNHADQPAGDEPSEPQGVSSTSNGP